MTSHDAQENRPDRLRRQRAAGLVLVLLAAASAACRDAGGRSRTPGTVGPPAGQVLDVDFALRTDLLLGSGFVGDVHHVDLNGDGISDLIETNFLPQEVTVSLGQPDGTFGAVAVLSTLGPSWRLTLGDFDGNGLEDVAVLCREWLGAGTQSIEVHLQGPAPAEFSAPPLTVILDTDPIDLASAPISGGAGDPGPDELFVAVRGDRELKRMRLQGGALVQSGSLESSNLTSAGGAFSVAVIDLGNDGRLDVVAGEDEIPGLPDRVVAYGRTPAGDFAPAQLVMAPLEGPIVDNAGDVDGNGFDDVAVAQLRGRDVVLLRGDAAGLSAADAIDFGARTTSVIFPDLDGDGLLDAVATTLNQSSVQVRMGNGPMSWGEPTHYGVGPVPRAIDTILLPGDAIPDLLCGNANDITILVGVGGGEFRAAKGYDTQAEGLAIVELADLDNDGDLDAVVVSRRQRAISFLEGDGQGGFQARVVLPLMPTAEETPAGIAVGDVDGDGFLDVLSSVVALDEVRLYRNPGSVDGFADPLPMDVTTVEGEPKGLAMTDVDGDTLPDVVVTNFAAGTVQVLRNVGGGELSPQPGVAVAMQPIGLAAMDFDLDGDVDLAVVGEDGPAHRFLVLDGDGAGGFTTGASHPIDGPTDSIVLGDFDEDDLADVAIGQTESVGDELFLLLNRGGLTFESRRLQAFPGPTALSVADLDNDQHLDLMVATTPGELVVLLGDGLGAFPRQVPGERGRLPAVHQAVGSDLGDLDGDGLLDHVSVSTQNAFLWVSINTSTPSAVQN